MTRPALYRPPDDDIYKFARLVYDGLPPRIASQRMKWDENTGFVVLSRLRKEVLQNLGRPVSDAMVLRLLFDKENAENALKNTPVSILTTTT